MRSRNLGADCSSCEAKGRRPRALAGEEGSVSTGHTPCRLSVRSSVVHYASVSRWQPTASRRAILPEPSPPGVLCASGRSDEYLDPSAGLGHAILPQPLPVPNGIMDALDVEPGSPPTG